MDFLLWTAVNSRQRSRQLPGGFGIFFASTLSQRLRNPIGKSPSPVKGVQKCVDRFVLMAIRLRADNVIDALAFVVSPRFAVIGCLVCEIQPSLLGSKEVGQSGVRFV